MMKSSVILSLVAAASLVAVAAEEKPQVKVNTMTPERAARLKETIYRKTGGMVRKTDSAKGYIGFLNAQKRVPRTAMGSVFDLLGGELLYQVKFVEAPNVNPLSPKDAIRAEGCAAGVVLVDRSDLPVLLTAPEDGWAVLNVAPLAADNPDAEKLARRVRLEMRRAMALACGCSFMSRGYIVMGEISTLQELDGLREMGYGVDVINKMRQYLGKKGVCPWIEENYRKACRQGWALPPTNDVQKAIWDAVKDEKERGPVNALQIVPPKK